MNGEEDRSRPMREKKGNANERKNEDSGGKEGGRVWQRQEADRRSDRSDLYCSLMGLHTQEELPVPGGAAAPAPLPSTSLFPYAILSGVGVDGDGQRQALLAGPRPRHRGTIRLRPHPYCLSPCGAGTGLAACLLEAGPGSLLFLESRDWQDGYKDELGLERLGLARAWVPGFHQPRREPQDAQWQSRMAEKTLS